MRAGRSQSIHLTPKAIALREAATAAARAQNEVALAGLSTEERGLCIDLMRRVIAPMQADER